MRCFILGNGPSLNDTDLDALRTEITFGVNQCELIYPKTSWRPKYWVCNDRDLKIPIGEWAELFLSHYLLGEHCFIAPRHITRLSYLPAHEEIWDSFTKKSGWPAEWKNGIVPIPRFEVLDLCRLHGTRIGMEDKWPLSWHLPQLCLFAGSIPTTIQLAVTMGFDEIYMLGCDLGYKVGINHFRDDYPVFRPYDEEWAAYFERALVYAHSLAAKECEARGVKIYNAGTGGKLTAYPRIRLEDALL